MGGVHASQMRAAVRRVGPWAPVSCEDFAATPSYEEGLEEGLADVEVASYQELEQTRAIHVQPIEGLQVQVTVPFKSLDQEDEGIPQASRFSLQHLIMLGQQSMLQSTAVYQESAAKSLAATVASQGPGSLMVIPAITYPIAHETTLNLQSVMSNGSGAPAIDSFEASTTTKGPDYVFGLNHSRHSQRGDSWTVSYFQSVVKSLALGGQGTFPVKPGTVFGISDMTWGLRGAWQNEDQSVSVLGRYDHKSREARVGFFRAVDDKLKLSAQTKLSLTENSSVSAAAEVPLRRERQLGPVPYTNLVAEVEAEGSPADPDVTFRMNVDHMLLQGQGGVTMSGSWNHKQRDYKFGVGFRLAA